MSLQLLDPLSLNSFPHDSCDCDSFSVYTIVIATIVLWIGGDERMIELIMFMSTLSDIWNVLGVVLRSTRLDKQTSTSPEPSAKGNIIIYEFSVQFNNYTFGTTSIICIPTYAFLFPLGHTEKEGNN